MVTTMQMQSGTVVGMFHVKLILPFGWASQVRHATGGATGLGYKVYGYEALGTRRWT